MSLTIKDHAPQLPYTKIIFWMQIRNTWLLFRVKSDSAISDICRYCYFWTSVDAASHSHFVFCCQSNFFCSSSAASLLLVPDALYSQWLGGHVLFPAVQPLCQKHEKLLQSCYALWSARRYALNVSQRRGSWGGYSLPKTNLVPNTKDSKGKWKVYSDSLLLI